MPGTVTSSIVRSKTRRIVRLTAVLTTTDTSGVITAAKFGAGFGRIVGVAYKPGTLDTGADIIIKDASTGAAILTLTNAGTTNRFFRPTAVITSNLGVAVTAAATATEVDRDIYVAGHLTAEVAQAGATIGFTGTIVLIIDEGVDTSAA